MRQCFLKRKLYSWDQNVSFFPVEKHINIGRGGMILLDDKNERDTIKMRYDGRQIYEGVLHKDENVTEIGYHYYMTPESAKIGLEIFPEKA